MGSGLFSQSIAHKSGISSTTCFRTFVSLPCDSLSGYCEKAFHNHCFIASGCCFFFLAAPAAVVVVVVVVPLPRDDDDDDDDGCVFVCIVRPLFMVTV